MPTVTHSIAFQANRTLMNIDLFCIIMINNNEYLHIWYQRLYLCGELVDESGIIVNRNVGYYINGEHIVFL